MSPPSAVIEVADEHVQRIVVILLTRDREGGLVAPKPSRGENNSFGARASVPIFETLPRSATVSNEVDNTKHLRMIFERRVHHHAAQSSRRNKMCLRHLLALEQELGELKLEAALIWSPIAGLCVYTRSWGSVVGQGISERIARGICSGGMSGKLTSDLNVRKIYRSTLDASQLL